MIRDDAWKTYESWRRVWLSGGDSNAIGALRFHGQRGALAVAGGACNRTRPGPPPSSVNVELPVANAAIAEAASQVRRLLRVPSPCGDRQHRVEIRGEPSCLKRCRWQTKTGHFWQSKIEYFGRGGVPPSGCWARWSCG